MSLSQQLQTALVESKNDGSLSTVKKKAAPHMWFIAKTGKGSWVVSVGDPTKSSSKLKRTFHSKDELVYWVKHEKEVSNDHIIDRSGLKLVPEYYSQWYVDNMLKKESVDLKEEDLKGAQAYIRRIKNAGKKKYAEAWLKHLQGKGEWPSNKEFGISFMAAQGVRMSLEDFGFDIAESALKV